jgi:serine/threonine protein phosphatase PrpC
MFMLFLSSGQGEAKMRDFWRKIIFGKKPVAAGLASAETGQGALASDAERDKNNCSVPSDLTPWSLYRVGQATDQGQNREYNEDSLFLWRSVLRRTHNYVPFGLFMVADGMGGHANGESASELATHVVASQVIREVFLPFLQVSDCASPIPINEALVSAMENANQVTSHEIPGAGTTLTAMLLMGETVFFAHVGDTRAYLITQDKIERLTQDHSLVGRLLQVGAISEEDAAKHPQRNIIYRSVGQGETLQADWHSLELPAESCVLLCCDGLWGSVTDAQIKRIVNSAAHPQQACNQLVQTARQQGSTDDITMVLIERGKTSHAD